MEGILTTIDTYPDTRVPHAPSHMEENMPENHSRRQLDIFGRQSWPHALSETRVGAETDDALRDAPTVISRKKIKNCIITGTPLTPRRDFCVYRGTKSLIHCSMKY